MPNDSCMVSTAVGVNYDDGDNGFDAVDPANDSELDIPDDNRDVCRCTL